MKKTAQRVWRSFAILGLLTISFSACKKDATINPVTETVTSGLAAHPNFKASTMAAALTSSAPITLTNQSNITISGISTSSITLTNCSNILITNCKVGPNTGVGITIYKCTNVRVSNCYISNVSSGVCAVQSQGINVSGNYGLNMQGPYPRGQFVQFNNVNGTGNRINSNKIQNILGQSAPQDIINVYQSNGTAADPIQVNQNQIIGGGPSSSGGGIMLGDGGGSYVTANWNTLVNPGQYGMAVAGGTHMTIYQNNIYSKKQSFSNVGLYYWNQSGLPSSDVTISNNNVNFTMYDGEINNTYLPWGHAVPNGWNTNYYNKSLNETCLPAILVTIP